MPRSFRRLCVYCGSHDGCLPQYAAMARRLGLLLAERGIGLVYGGGNVGLMGRVADAVLEQSGEVWGVIPRALQDKELAHAGATRMDVVESMHERKQQMADAADGFITLPGGIGTLEELFETFTWLQLGFHDKPVGILDVDGFYAPLLSFLEKLVEQGFLRRAHLDSLLVDDDPERLLDRMASFTPPQLGRWWPSPNHADPR
ncbi:MAG: TIGR00730 family Rossman fold protein [Pirellulales bacterium]